MPTSRPSTRPNSSPAARRSVGFCEGVSTRCSVGSAPGAAPETASAAASTSSTVPPTSARIAGEDITLRLVREILIVDDHADARDALLGMVEAAGYPAVAVANPAGALARVAEHRPALILLDMMMPEIDGADFLVRLRRLRGGDAVPVIVVSGIGHLLQGLHGAEAAAAGVREVLAKPVKYATLVDAIRRVIGSPQGDPPTAPAS